jgi:hypothetical protein
MFRPRPSPLGSTQAALSILLVASALPALGDAPATVPWSLLNCFYAYGIAAAPYDAVQARLPSGFQAKPYVIGVSGVPVAPVPLSKLAAVGFEIDVCAAGEGMNGLVAPMHYASIWTPAIPPPELAVGQPTFVNWDVLVPDGDRLAVLQTAGLPAHGGAIALTHPVDEFQHFDASYTMEGLGTFAMDSLGVGIDTSFPLASFAQYTARADGGLARWTTDYTTSSAQPGAGYVFLPEGSWLAEMFGAPVVPARFTFGTWEYTDGLIELSV